jgi:uncharacterized YigZ family protein
LQRHEETDSYKTIESSSEAELKILASKFLAFAYPLKSSEDFFTRLDALKKKYYDATHHCYAYQLGFDGEVFKYSDDGEPNGSAGKRISGSIDRFGLTDIGIVVVRYFGGTKLGVGGLSRAYGDSANAAIDSATIVTRYLKKSFRVSFPYDVTSSVHRIIENYGVEILNRVYGDDVNYDIRVRESRLTAFKRDVTDQTQRTIRFIED